MKKTVTITGLDIGSSKICAVLTEMDTAGQSRIIGIYAVPSRGVERGHVVDLNLAVDSVSKVLEGLEDRAGRRADNIYANISGRSISAQRARGMVSLSMRGREITEGDMKRCVNVASTIRVPFDRDIIHRIVHSYTIDDQTEVKSPFGLYGSRLAVDIYVITASINHIQNIKKVVNNCGCELKGIAFGGMADSFSLFDNQDRQENIVIVDMGSSLTEVSIFQEGVLRCVEVLPLGAADIRGALDADGNLNGIISRIKEKVDEFDAKGVRFKSAVIAGGGSLVDGVVEAFEARLGLSAIPGAVKGLAGRISSLDSVIATTAIGLARYARKDYEKAARSEPKNLIKNLSSKVVDIFNNYF